MIKDETGGALPATVCSIFVLSAHLGLARFAVEIVADQHGTQTVFGLWRAIDFGPESKHHGPKASLKTAPQLVDNGRDLLLHKASLFPDTAAKSRQAHTGLSFFRCP